MRSNALLFLHVLLGMALLGGVLATAVASLASQHVVGRRAASLRSVSWWSALLTALAAIAAVGIGEALVADENAEGTWLDVSRALATFGLLAGGIVLAVLARLAESRPRLARTVGWLALLLTLISLVVVFLMAAKPS